MKTHQLEIRAARPKLALPETNMFDIIRAGGWGVVPRESLVSPEPLSKFQNKKFIFIKRTIKVLRQLFLMVPWDIRA